MSRKNNKPVIFLAFANEQGGEGYQGYLRKLPEEVRHLEEILERAEDKGLCELVIKTNATLEQILAVFQGSEYRDRVAIFHYGGHASSGGLYLESSDSGAREASAEGLAEFLGQQDGLELVFLNGCSTQSQARGLLDANVSAVIATSQAIDDAVATAFAGHFYSGLSGGASLRVAFNEAESAVVSDKGSDKRNLYRHIGAAEGSEILTEEFPWHLYIRPGAEITQNWNLPEAAEDPLLGLPELPERDLPDRPYRQLNFYTEQDAEVFFGRGYQIRDLYHLVTDATAAPIILYCGQSGVGKSSLLNAGLIPRLRHRDFEPHEVRDFRRRRTRGLTAMMGDALKTGDRAGLRDAWLELESTLDRPVTVIADQVEEVFTRPNPDLPGELEDFFDALLPVYANTGSRPRGKLIVSFRKEWVQDVKRRLEERKLPHTVRYLEALDRRGIVEAIEGPATSDRLREKYQLTIAQGLAETMAVQLLADAEAAVAPTLQIRLGRMWESAGSPPVFDTALYERLESEGFGLEQYLDREFEFLREKHEGAIESGLALDILQFHTTSRGTAEARSEAELQSRYGHVEDEVRAFIADCKARYLLVDILTIASSEGEPVEVGETRLAHDTLAPLIRERFDRSGRPGQRARRILENRAVDWRSEPWGAALDDTDLDIVQRGRAGMRELDEAEQRLLEASVGEREQREETERQRARIRRLNKRLIRALAAALVLSGLFAVFWGFRASDRADQVYAAGVTSLAAAQHDPLLASLLISSLEADQKPANAVQVALEIAHSTVPLDIMSMHSDDVNSVACSPDQKSVVTASSDATARVWAIGGQGDVIALGPHDRRLNGAIFNPNSRQVVTWSDDGKVYVQMAHGQDTPRLVADHREAVETVQFDPRDDTLLMTASDDGSVNIWDVTGEGDSCLALPGSESGIDESSGNDGGRAETNLCKVRVLAEPGDPVRSASYSPDGSHLVAVTESGAVRLWRSDSPGSWVEYEIAPFHADQVMDAVFNPPVKGPENRDRGRSTLLVTTSRDTTAAIWALDPDSEHPVLTDPSALAGHSDWVNSAQFSPDGRRLVTVSDDDSAVYWDPENPTGFVRLCGHQKRVVSGQFSERGEFIVTASEDDTARVWETLALEQYLQERLSTSDPARAALLENPECTAASPVKPLKVLQGHMDDLTGATFCGADRFVVTASRDDTVRLWDLARRAEPRVLARRASAAVSVDVNWNGTLVAAAFEGDPGLVVDLDGSVRKNLGEAGSVDFMPERRARLDGDYVLTTAKSDPAGRSRTRVHEWPVAQGNPATLAEGGPFETAVYGPGGDRFITSNRRGFAEVRKVNRERLDCCEALGRRSLYAEFSHDGTQVLAARLDGTAVLGPAPGAVSVGGASPEPVSLGGHSAFLTMAVFSPDDRYVATASGDNTIRITPVGGSGESRVLRGHGGTVQSVAFSSDGKHLVSGSDDGTARVWNLDGTGEPVVLAADGSAVRSARFSPDDRRVITASNDGAVRVWRYRWDDLLPYLDESTRMCLTVQQRMAYLNEGREAAGAAHEKCMNRKRGRIGGESE